MINRLFVFILLLFLFIYCSKNVSNNVQEKRYKLTTLLSLQIKNATVDVRENNDIWIDEQSGNFYTTFE
jgi:YbbR domain-containing protein